MPTTVKFIKPINTQIIYEALTDAIAAGVNEVASRAEQRVLKDVPVRKVFRYGRTRGPGVGFRIQGRQETRTLSTQEARAESAIRRRLGLGSAFTDAEGNQRKSPQIQTALFPGNYRTHDRANGPRSLGRRNVSPAGGSRERLVTIDRSVMVPNSAGRMVPVPFANPDTPEARAAQSDLSARGRYELKRKKNSAITKKGDDRTLGGALRNSVELMRAIAESRGSHITATIQAGSEEVDYAKYVEFGTAHARAQPFLRPALAQAREELLKEVAGHLRRYETRK